MINLGVREEEEGGSDSNEVGQGHIMGFSSPPRTHLHGKEQPHTRLEQGKSRKSIGWKYLAILN